MPPAERPTDRQAYERAQQHDRKAQRLRARGQALIASAELHQRWAQRWRDWADDEYGDVPYPLDR